VGRGRGKQWRRHFSQISPRVGLSTWRKPQTQALLLVVGNYNTEFKKKRRENISSPLLLSLTPHPIFHNNASSSPAQPSQLRISKTIQEEKGETKDLGRGVSW
jgi:hypothetical protein